MIYDWYLILYLLVGAQSLKLSWFPDARIIDYHLHSLSREGAATRDAVYNFTSRIIYSPPQWIPKVVRR